MFIKDISCWRISSSLHRPALICQSIQLQGQSNRSILLIIPLFRIVSKVSKRDRHRTSPIIWTNLQFKFCFPNNLNSKDTWKILI